MTSSVKLNEKMEPNKLTNLLVLSGLLFSIARLVRGTDILYIFAVLSFLSLWVSGYKSIFSLEFKRNFIWFIPFGIWATLSSIWSLELFASLGRGMFYIFISSTAVLIGFLYKNKLNELFNIFLILNTLIVFISIVSLVSGIPTDAWTVNHGMGFTSIFKHQNSFAAVLMFTLIGPIYFLLNNNANYFWQFIPNLFWNSPKQMLQQVQHDNELISHSNFNSKTKEEYHSEAKEATKKKDSVISNLFRVRNLLITKNLILLSILLILNLYFIYLSYSRAVMLALFVGAIVLILLLGNKKSNLKFILLFSVFAVTMFFLFGNKIEKYLQKGNSNYLARRNILWEPSYDAALNGGLVGLGYGITDPEVSSIYKKENILGKIKREKGNSILAIVEETGVVGLILFALPIGYVLKIAILGKIVTNLNPFNFEFSLLFSFLIAFIIHAQFEAWMVGVSSFFLIVFIIFTNILVD